MSREQYAGRRSMSSGGLRYLPASLLVALLFCGIASRLQAQSPPRTPERAEFDRYALYIVFFSQHADDVNRRAISGRGPTADAVAARLRIRAEELGHIDQHSGDYGQVDRAIHLEARAYYDHCRAAHKPSDPAVVYSFTDRRLSHITQILATLRSELSPESFAGFTSYVKNDFRNILHSAHPGGI